MRFGITQGRVTNMPDEKTGTEGTQETETEETETEDKTSQKKEGGDGTADDKGKKETEEEEETESEEDFEPEVRKRDKKDFIIERLQKKNEKLQAKANDSEDDEEDEDENPDSQSVEAIVDKKLAPVLKQQQEAEDKAEVEGFIADNPQFKPYRDKMLKYRSHPAYEQLPIQHIATIAAGKDLMKLGASEAAKADQEAKQGQMGGGSARGKTGEKKSVWDMSKEEWEQHKQNVLTQARNNE